MRNLTLTIQFCDISQSFVSATKYENTSRKVLAVHDCFKHAASQDFFC
jgi:hypothetical protein